MSRQKFEMLWVPCLSITYCHCVIFLFAPVKEQFAKKWNFSNYRLIPTLMESQVTFRSQQNISEVDGELFWSVKKKW